ncbi:MAG: DUF4397 domain-containing protein [Bradymonadaceae bacterium]|nr:DUF4397 domain-containing protein [Lujinxingiaceae bacterium]
MTAVLISSVFATGCPGDDDPDPVNDVGLDVTDVTDVDDVVDDVTDVDLDVARDADVDPDVDLDAVTDVVDDVVNDVIDTEQAQMMLIHNSADPNAAQVDIYINGELWADDLSYRSGEGFRNVTPGIAIEIAVAGSDSATVADAIATFGPYTLEADTRYIFIASGVLVPANFTENPQDREIAFNLVMFEDARFRSDNTEVDQTLIFHGVTDAPAISILANNELRVVESLSYGEFTENYIDLPRGVLVFDVEAVDGDRVASFQTPSLSGGQAWVLVASGFLDAAQNPSAPLHVIAFPTAANGARVDGTVLERAARVQFVNDVADPDIGTMDVFINDQSVALGLAYRHATAFRTLPSGTNLSYEIRRPEGDGGASVLTQVAQFEPGLASLAVLSGVVDPDDFTANPGGADIGLNIFTTSMARERANGAETVGIILFHGVTDAPAVDIEVTIGADPDTFVAQNLAYGEFSEPLALDAGTYTLQVRAAGDATAVANIPLAIGGLTGQAISVIASGFLSPTGTQPGFALVAITPEGEATVIPVNGL